jgi:TATA-binding protein-associated factor Taf7
MTRVLRGSALPLLAVALLGLPLAGCGAGEQTPGQAEASLASEAIKHIEAGESPPEQGFLREHRGELEELAHNAGFSEEDLERAKEEAEEGSESEEREYAEGVPAQSPAAEEEAGEEAEEELEYGEDGEPTEPQST